MVIPCLESAVNITTTTNNNHNKVSFENVSRPLLIFKHNPKAAGGTIKAILNEFKPNVYGTRKLCEDTDDNNINNNMDISSSYLLFMEPSSVPADARNFGFVISSIREPCDHLLSLWAYGSAGHGAFKNSFRHSEKELYGKDAPHFDSERDIDAFHQWLRHPRVRNIMESRFVTNYLSKEAGNKAKHLHDIKTSKHVEKGKLDMHKYDKPAEISHQRNHNHNVNKTEIPQNVDCWVYVDDFQQTLYTCLKEYENQGGFVNWTTPSLTQLVTDLQEKLVLDDEEHNNDRKLEIEYVNKNNVHESTQLSHHLKCFKYYDDESADFVRHGSSSFIYDMFGYDQCCGTRPNPKNKVILPPLPVQKTLYDMNSSVQHYLVGLSLIFLTLFFFAFGVVKLVKRYYYYGVNRNNNGNQYDRVESQEEEEL